MVETKMIVKFCEDYLETSKWKDYCHNGLQVEGRDKVGRIVTGVSLSQALIREAVRRKADMIMAHHGIFDNDLGHPVRLRGYTAKRLALLLSHGINLCGFHLPLDAHPVIGNNISLLKAFKLKKIGVMNSPEYGDIGYIGELSKPMAFKRFAAMVDEVLGTRSAVVAGGQKQSRLIGIVSGGASPDFAAAAEAGADTYVCGDIRESTVRAVEETGINFINAGHYNTEKMGIKNLGELVARKFRIPVEFVDVPNEV